MKLTTLNAQIRKLKDKSYFIAKKRINKDNIVLTFKNKNNLLDLVYLRIYLESGKKFVVIENETEICKTKESLFELVALVNHFYLPNQEKMMNLADAILLNKNLNLTDMIHYLHHNCRNLLYFYDKNLNQVTIKYINEKNANREISVQRQNTLQGSIKYYLKSPDSGFRPIALGKNKRIFFDLIFISTL